MKEKPAEFELAMCVYCSHSVCRPAFPSVAVSRRVHFGQTDLGLMCGWMAQVHSHLAGTAWGVLNSADDGSVQIEHQSI